MKVFDDSMSLRVCASRVTSDPRGWTTGEVLTPHGIVAVYAQGDATQIAHTRLDFVYMERLYIRSINGKRYSMRGLVTLARRFVDDAMNGQIV